MRKRQSAGERSDARARARIASYGWEVNAVSPYVATKTIYEREDDTVTRKFESAFTLEAVAKQVARREREEAR